MENIGFIVSRINIRNMSEKTANEVSDNIFNLLWISQFTSLVLQKIERFLTYPEISKFKIPLSYRYNIFK